jgi:hypothetical protein
MHKIYFQASWNKPGYMLQNKLFLLIELLSSCYSCLFFRPLKEGKMKKNLSKLALLFMVLFVVAGFMSCDNNLVIEPLAIIGDWDIGYGSTLTVTASKFINTSSDDTVFFSYDIVVFDNNDWNASESGEGSYGFIVVKCSKPSVYTPEAKDKYMVVRWQNLESGETTTMEFAEGSDYPVNTYFDTFIEAMSSATEAAGFFGYFSTATTL